MQQKKTAKTAAYVAPVRERGLKLLLPLALMAEVTGRSREGAWIEIKFLAVAAFKTTVAPVRERGLKYICNNMFRTQAEGRSREGAWIEIKVTAPTVL